MALTSKGTTQSQRLFEADQAFATRETRIERALETAKDNMAFSVLTSDSELKLMRWCIRSCCDALSLIFWRGRHLQ